MPHLVIEASAGAVSNPSGLLAQLLEVATEFESVDPASVKARFYETAIWATGQGCPDQFVHVSFSLLKGRSPELRTKMGEAFFSVLAEEFGARYEARELSLTVEVREMDSIGYRK